MESVTESVIALETFLTDSNVRFPRLPRLLPDLGIYPMPEGIGIQFRGVLSGIAFRGAGAAAVFDYLLEALDGTRDLATLAAQRPADVSHSELLRTLSLLHTKGLLQDGDLAGATDWLPPDETARRQLLFWGRNLGLTGYLRSAGEAQARLSTARVVVVGTGLFGAVTCDLLRRSGCEDLSVIDWDDSGFLLDALSGPAMPRSAVHLNRTSIDGTAEVLRERAPDADLVIAATRNAPAALFRVINRICLDSGCSALFANDDGSEFQLGPYVLPYAAACYGCLELRKASAHDNMLEEHVYQRHLTAARAAGETCPLGESVISATLAASLIGLEATRILTRAAMPTLLNAALTLSPLSGTIETHPVLRVPRCPECSGGSTLPIAASFNGRSSTPT